MKEILLKDDKAVSPIIATVLLVGITVTMIATAYSLLENYIPNPVPQSPTAALKIVNNTIIDKQGNVIGNYSISLNSLNGNLSVNDVTLIITFSNLSVSEVSLNSVYTAGHNELTLTPSINIFLSSSAGYLTSTSSIRIEINNASAIDRIALADTHTGGSVGSGYVS